MCYKVVNLCKSLADITQEDIDYDNYSDEESLCEADIDYYSGSESDSG